MHKYLLEVQVPGRPIIRRVEDFRGNLSPGQKLHITSCAGEKVEVRIAEIKTSARLPIVRLAATDLTWSKLYVECGFGPVKNNNALPDP